VKREIRLKLAFLSIAAAQRGNKPIVIEVLTGPKRERGRAREKEGERSV